MKYVITGFRDFILNPNDFGCNNEADNPTVMQSAAYAFELLAQMKKFIIERKTNTWGDSPYEEAQILCVQQLTMLD